MSGTTSPKRVIVAMSGGVDSSVAAARVIDQGYDVIGVTLHLFEPKDPGQQSRCCAPEDVREAQRIAHRLGFPHYTLDRRKLFAEAIVRPFVNAYLVGKTPSPCALCNHLIKIPTLLRIARMVGAAFVVTGHYAQLIHSPGQIRLARGRDLRKDQSYFLSTLDTHVLSNLQFPLGHDTKENVRKEAQQRGLTTANKGESQDLCFVPSGTYAEFIEQQAPDRLKPGWIEDSSGHRLCRHNGIHRFTLGQRKGLGFSSGKRWFVTRIEAQSGTIVVEPDAANRIVGVIIEKPNIAEGLELPTSVSLQVRYRDNGTAATLERMKDGSVLASLHQPIAFATPGQLAVGYAENEVVIGGTIGGTIGGGA